jgi:hypothetical protein
MRSSPTRLVSIKLRVHLQIFRVRFAWVLKGNRSIRLGMDELPDKRILRIFHIRDIAFRNHDTVVNKVNLIDYLERF